MDVVNPGTVEHLTQVISHVVAPAFMLGAVASFTSILMTRMGLVLDRIRDLNAVPASGHHRSELRTDLPRLQRRLHLLNRSIILSVASGAVAALLILIAFAAALAQIQHVWVAAILFIVSMALLIASLTLFGIELCIGLSTLDQR